MRFENAVHRCDGAPEIILLDGGEAIHMTVGGTSEFAVASEVAFCILTNLKAPGSMLGALDQTNEMSDVQTEVWDGIRATWTYSADIGLDMLLQLVAKL